MFFICRKNDNGTFGIIDTKDGVIEDYTPKQIMDFVIRQNLQIDGVSRQKGNIIRISVVKPKEYDILNSEDFVDETVTKELAKNVAKDKLLGSGLALYDMFKNVKFIGRLGNYKTDGLKLVLTGLNYVNSFLLFGFAYDYSCDVDFDTDILRKCIEDSPYKVELLTNTQLQSIRGSDNLFKLSVSKDLLTELLKQTVEFYNFCSACGKVPDTFKNLSVVRLNRDTNIGLCECYSIFFKYDIYSICIAHGVRKGYLLNLSASDFKIYKVIKAAHSMYF